MRSLPLLLACIMFRAQTSMCFGSSNVNVTVDENAGEMSVPDLFSPDSSSSSPYRTPNRTPMRTPSLSSVYSHISPLFLTPRSASSTFTVPQHDVSANHNNSSHSIDTPRTPMVRPILRSASRVSLNNFSTPYSTPRSNGKVITFNPIKDIKKYNYSIEYYYHFYFQWLPSSRRISRYYADEANKDSLDEWHTHPLIQRIISWTHRAQMCLKGRNTSHPKESVLERLLVGQSNNKILKIKDWAVLWTQGKSLKVAAWTVEQLANVLNDTANLVQPK